MAGLFGEKINNGGAGGNFVNPNSPEALIQKHTVQYDRSRYNLLLVTAFTAINVLLLAIQSGGYFLFSTYIPLVLIDTAMWLCGKYPAEEYALYEPFEFYDSSLFIGAIVVSVIIALLYFFCFLFSGKKRVGWMITGLVFFSVDTLLMFALGGVSANSILDIVFHAWVIVSLSLGISSHNKLKKIPVQAPASFEEMPVAPVESEETKNIE